MAHNQSYNENTVHERVDLSNNITLNTNFISEQQQQPEFWLPIPLNFEGSQLCQIYPSKNLTTHQRTFQPITSLLNDSDEFYPLLANVP
ncbi:unnamed protein product, partial [Rotaria sordida]